MSVLDQIDAQLAEIAKQRQTLENLGEELAEMLGYDPATPHGKSMVTIATMGTDFNETLKTIMNARKTRNVKRNHNNPPG